MLSMRRKYIKPMCQIKALKQRVLTQASNVGVHWGDTGKLDAKECSMNFYEDDNDE